MTGYNTYVGARYVPIFDKEWDKTKEYEPLIIVSNNGNSYTSKTYVPAGVEITNETYWALTGNYNAQVEYYRQETANVAKRVDYLDTYVTPQMYGAKADGVTDDSNAIQTAIDTGKNVYMPKGQYKIISGITTRGTLYCDGNIIYSGEGTAITIGANWQKVFINEITCSEYKATAVGVIPTGGCHGMDVTVKIIREANKGIYLCSNSDEEFIQYCSFKFDWINANYGIYGENPNNNGWINQNFFYGGHLNHGIGVYFASKTGIYNNANMFYNIGFEQLNRFVILNNCQYFKFFDTRMIESENYETDLSRVALTNCRMIYIDTPVDLQIDTISCSHATALVVGTLIDKNVTILAHTILIDGTDYRLVDSATNHISYFNVDRNSNITINDGYDLSYIHLIANGEGTVTIDSKFASAVFGYEYYDTKGYYTSILNIDGVSPINFVRKTVTNKLYPGIYLIEYTSSGYQYKKLDNKDGVISHADNANSIVNNANNFINKNGIINCTNWETSNVPNSLPGLLYTVSRDETTDVVYQYFMSDTHIYSRSVTNGSFGEWTQIV